MFSKRNFAKILMGTCEVNIYMFIKFTRTCNHWLKLK